MLLNFDLKERAQKERKSKLYKHMLDEQIRDNEYYRQKKSRIKTEPIYQYERQKNKHKLQTKDSLKLKQQSLFLPVIAKAQVNDVTSPLQYTPIIRKRVPKQRSKNHYRNFSYTKKMDDSDQQLEKCLYDCQQLLGQFGSQSNIRHNRKKFSKRNSEYNNILDQPIEVQRIFKSPRLNNQKSNQKRDQIVHMSIPSQPSSYKKLNFSQDFQTKQLRTLKKTKNQTKPTKEFETIKYLTEHDTILNQQHDFSGNNIKSLQQKYKSKQGYLNEFQESLQQFKIQGGENKKIKLKNQVFEKQKLKQSFNISKDETNKKRLLAEQKQKQQIQNQKKIYVLKHLRKAKNRGNLLFKKIQQFRNQQMKKNVKNNV